MTDERLAWLHAQIDDDAATFAALDSTALNGIESTAGSDAREYIERIPAEVEAKRRILAIHRRRADVTGDSGGTFDDCCHGCGYEGICDDPIVGHVNDCPERRAMAAVYSNRPGYQELWGQQ